MTANGSRSPCPAWRKKVQTREQSSSPAAVCRAGLKNEHPSLTQPHAVHNVFLSSVQHGWRCSHWSFASFQDSSPCDVCSVFQIFWSHVMAKPNVLFFHWRSSHGHSSYSRCMYSDMPCELSKAKCCWFRLCDVANLIRVSTKTYHFSIIDTSFIIIVFINMLNYLLYF